MKLNKTIIFIVLLPFLGACQTEEPHILASNRWQISEQVIVDGKLSDSGEFTSLLLSDNSLELWNNQVRQKVSVWPNEQLVPNTVLLDMSDTAEYLLSASDTVIQLWHTESKEALGMIDISEHLGDAKITQIRFWISPHRFFIGTSSGDVIFADTQNNTYRVNRHHSSEVVKLELSKDKHTLYSGGNDGLVVKWDLVNYRPAVTKRLPFRIVSLAVGSNNIVFVSDALKDHILWNSEQDSVSGQISHWKRFKWFRKALLDPNQRWLVTSSPKTDMQIWSLDDMQMRGSWLVETQSLGSSVQDMVLMNEHNLRTLTTDGVLQDWDLRSFHF